jgi:hypothetical protein
VATLVLALFASALVVVSGVSGATKGVVERPIQAGANPFVTCAAKTGAPYIGVVGFERKANGLKVIVRTYAAPAGHYDVVLWEADTCTMYWYAVGSMEVSGNGEGRGEFKCEDACWKQMSGFTTFFIDLGIPERGQSNASLAARP